MDKKGHSIQVNKFNSYIIFSFKFRYIRGESFEIFYHTNLTGIKSPLKIKNKNVDIKYNNLS